MPKLQSSFNSKAIIKITKCWGKKTHKMLDFKMSELKLLSYEEKLNAYCSSIT